MDFITNINQVWPMLSVLTSVASVLAAVAAAFCLYHLNKRFVSRQEHEDLAADMASGQAKHDQRLDVLERRMETVPSGKDIHKLQLAVEEMRGDNKAMRAQLDGMKDAMDGIGNNIDMLVRAHLKE